MSVSVFKTLILICFTAGLCSLRLSAQEKEQAAIYKIQENDTLTAELAYAGCSGGLSYKYNFYKKDGKLFGISYKSIETAEQNPVWKIDKIVSLNRNTIKSIEEYELHILNYIPSPHTNGFTGGGEFKLYSVRGFSIKKEVNGFDSIKFGDNIHSIFK